MPVLYLGSFGRVMLARNRRSGEFFAMKRLKKSDIIKLRQVDHVISENTILADIEHPFLVSYKNDMMDALALFFTFADCIPHLKGMYGRPEPSMTSTNYN